MSGHSKWHNIMHKKGKTDAQRAKVFAKISKEIIICVKEGGADPSANNKLRDAIAKAKSNNMPNDNIDRVIKKATGANDNSNYENITYEGYGPSGTAIIVDCLTDNRNRTAGNLRHYFDKYGGNLGQSGSVAWQFENKGVIIIDKEKADEETLMMSCLDKGVDDFTAGDDVFEITTLPEEFSEIRESLEGEGYEFLQAEKAMIPNTTVTLENEEDIKKMETLLSLIDDDEDVQNFYHNCENVEY